MGDKFESYSEVMNALVGEAISCSPESWRKGLLSIECDGSYMDYALKNDDASEKAQISGELRALCEELYVVMRQAGDLWLGATIHFFRENDQWSFKAEFKYPQPAVFTPLIPLPSQTMEPETPVSRPGALPGAKPWWRFW